MSLSEAQTISAVFQNLLKSNDAKLRTGAFRREQMRKLMEDGGDLSENHRFQWLDATSRETLKFLAQRARAFNGAHADDRISVQDLVDVLERTISLLRDSGT